MNWPYDPGAVVTVDDREGEWRVFGYDRTTDTFNLTAFEPSDTTLLTRIPPKDMHRVGEIESPCYNGSDEVIYDDE